ncbi:MAG: hypothetical protein R3F34_07595 [Planctomycetota bacterium]
MTPARLFLSLLLVASYPILTAFPVGPPLDVPTRTAPVIAALLLVASAPRAATGRVPWWQSTALFAPVVALAAALDGGGTSAALALVVAALASRAVERTRTGAWSAAFWLVYLGPLAAALAFGWAADSERGSTFVRVSPFDLAARALRGDDVAWIGAACGAAIALLAPALAPRGDADDGGGAER